MKKNQKDSNDFWQRKFTLKVRLWHFLTTSQWMKSQNTLISFEYSWIQLTEKSLRITPFFMILDPTLYIKMCWHMGVVTDWFIWWILVVKAESFTKFEPMMKIFRVWIGRRKLQRFSKVKLTTSFHEFESTNFVFTKFSLFCFSTRYLEVFYCNQKCQYNCWLQRPIDLKFNRKRHFATL